jgi:transcriptional repressor NrdR
MKCPKCGSQDLKVNEKRDLEAEVSIRRRRECNACGNRFTTYERIENPSLLVVKKSGVKELFDRDKMAVGIRKALEKRPFGEDQVEEIIDELDRKINQHGDGEIKSTEIGDLVIEKLKDTDHVAYLRFASVYKSFDDELKELKSN